MRVLVDGRILGTDRPSGVERALRTLLVGMARIEGDHEILLGCAAPNETRDLGPRVRHAPLPGRLRTGRRGADVFLSPVTAVPPFGPLPRVATVHDLPWISGAPPERREWRHRIRTRLTLRAARRVVVPSRATRDALGRVPGRSDHVRVVPLGLHPGIHAPVDDRARRDVEALLAGITGSVLLNVGAVRRRKGLDLLRSAFLEVRARRPATLVLAGQGTERLRGAPGVIAAGFVDDATLLALYDRADVLVHAARVEGCGLTLLESMARGTPVVAAQSEAVAETTGEAAVLTTPGDAGALARGVQEILDDGRMRDDMIARGLDRAAGRTPEAQASLVLAVCREALS
jgi:glycosyltransferase involved in cell wall biosynthesis